MHAHAHGGVTVTLMPGPRTRGAEGGEGLACSLNVHHSLTAPGSPCRLQAFQRGLGWGVSQEKHSTQRQESRDSCGRLPASPLVTACVCHTASPAGGGGVPEAQQPPALPLTCSREEQSWDLTWRTSGLPRNAQGCRLLANCTHVQSSSIPERALSIPE